MEIKSFEECLNIAEQTQRNNHLLLGNGFSMDLFPKIFNYKALKNRITSKNIKQLFEKIETDDFEYVMRKLTDAVKVCEFYPEGRTLAKEITKDLDELKNTLINVIAESHPIDPKAITDDQYDYCYEFLKHFENGKKYSFNYDLLLYWVYMHFNNETTNNKKILECNDGFLHPKSDQSIVTWEIGREPEQNVYYVHGAMHIFSDGSTIEKYTWTNTGQPITEQVKESIDKQKYPIFISEGTKEHKLSRIQENGYLSRAFSSLKYIGGNLFIFGHSLRDEDDHVFEYINEKSKVKNIFISLFRDADPDDHEKIFNKVEIWKGQPKNNKEYYYYDSRSANVWGKRC